MSLKRKMLKLLFGDKNKKNKLKKSITIAESEYFMIKDGRNFEEYKDVTNLECTNKEFTCFLVRPKLCTIFEDCRLYT